MPNDPPYFIDDHAIQIAEDKYIDYEGVGRYFSHSCNPNCGFQGKFKLITRKAIKQDEALTFDYEMSERSDWRIECKCNEKESRKIMVLMICFQSTKEKNMVSIFLSG